MRLGLLIFLNLSLNTLCFAELAPVVKETIHALQKGEEVPFTSVIPNELPQVPKAIQDLLKTAARYGKAEADSAFFLPEATPVPRELRPYISGSQDFSRYIVDLEAENFFKVLFKHIAQNSIVTPVKLTGWDLFHGHVFAIIDSELIYPVDLAMVFHAKEYPRDYPFYGNQTQDPRIGSQCQTSDHDYHLRNYLWLLSTNQVVLLDPLQEGFPKTWIEPNTKFFTVDQDLFSSLRLFDLNYFPWFDEHKIFACP